ncbi:hypothetical protein Vadar_012334 [Vaccinium darrowii]|uniref:Uncharacterized protein n=1 Tax=Vaccinium darrowii TaxID=229202 RepID=A0ACB7Z448_9ERIC|nr:hypothetical protein Vadar_012334 [Vaccinium darrowii]
MDLVFVDGPFPAEGVEGEYEWCAFEPNKDFSDSYRKFDGCVAFLEDCLTRMGPFDGLMGFSQGASVTAVLPGMQAEGVALTSVPKIKFVMLIGGFKFGGSIFPAPNLAKNAFSSPIQCPSLHILSEKDRWKPDELLDSFVDPFVLHHPEGHVVPKLDEKGLEIMLEFIEKIQELL